MTGALMVVAIAFSVAAVKIFRPLTMQLGELLEQMRHDRQARTQEISAARMAELMDQLLDRFERIEERQEFTERVIESSGWKSGSAGNLAGGAPAEQGSRTGD
jgi:hypothetical protein